MPADRTLEVIEAFYDAAMDAALWPAALKSLTNLTHSQASSFWVLDGLEHPRLPTFLCINFDQKSIQEYLNGMAALDPTVRYLVAHPQQAIVHDGLLENGKDKDTRDYYDWHERNVETRFRMVGQTRVTPAVQAGVALHRTKKAGQYEAKDIERFAALQRHLQRALAIGFRIGSLDAMQQFSVEWLDRNGAGVVLLDEGGRVVFANRTAREICNSGDGVKLRTEGIMLARKSDNQALQSLIGSALRTTIAGASEVSTIRAARPSGKKAYVITAKPTSGKLQALSLFRPAACVVIADPEKQPTMPNQRLREAFGFTEAEARLAAALAKGAELRIAAEQLGITYGTARTRLAHIFQKADTKRQGELIRLILAALVEA